MMTLVTSRTTGSRRGYIRVASRGEDATLHPVPTSVKNLRGNERRAMAEFIARGCTHYTIGYYQGVPGKGYSNQYYYTVYTGYKKS